MANLSITPLSALLAPGQAVTFQVVDASNNPVSANWNLIPAVGSLQLPDGGVVSAAATSVIYIAPQVIQAAQTIALIAGLGNDSGTVSISLTPDEVSVVPARAELKAGESQQFLVLVAGAQPTGAKVSWTLSPASPELGTIDANNGLFQAPAIVYEPTTLTVLAADAGRGLKASASISLLSPPWRGMGVNLLGVYLLLVFCLVFLLAGLWPHLLPTPAAADVALIKAESNVEQKGKALQALKELAKKEVQVPTNQTNHPATRSGAKSTSPASTTTAQTTTAAKEDSSSLPADSDSAPRKDEILTQAQVAFSQATEDLSRARDSKKQADSPTVKTWLVDCIDRELDYLLLVLIAGSLGSFLHIAQSYSDFVGNRTIKSNWAWWYSMQPFIGAILALVYYATLRGGLLVFTVGSSPTVSEINTYSLVATSSIAGMFSKPATDKLGELFNTLFKSSTAEDRKDKLDSSKPGQGPPGADKSAQGGATGSNASATTKQG